MATTLYKIKGTEVTEEEAQAAASAFSPQWGYNFVCWSSARDSEVKVNFPIKVENDMTFYPVIKIEDLFKESALPDGTYTAYNLTEGLQEKFLTCPAVNDYTEFTDGILIDSENYPLTDRAASNYLHIGATIGRLNESTPRPPYVQKFKDIIDFGFIQTSTITTAASFSVVSEFSGATYYLKLTKTDTGFDTELYALYDTKLPLIIPAARLTKYNQGDIMPVEEILAYLGVGYELRYISYEEI